MINRHETKHGGLMEKHPEPETRPTDVLLQQEIAELEKECESVTSVADKRTWQTIALWIFLIVCFAIFVLAAYMVWAKCDGTSHS